MNEGKQKKERYTKVVPISIGPRQFGEVQEMAKHYDASISELARMAFREFRKMFVRETAGYQAGSNSLTKQSLKNRKEDFFTRLEAADDAEATRMLIAIDYIEAPYERADNPGVKNEFKVEGGALKRYITQTWLQGKAPDVSIVWATKEELVENVKNEIKQGRLKIKE